MTLSQVRINLGPAGSRTPDRIVVDGRNVTNQVVALEMRAAVGRVDELTLTLRVTQSVEMSGPARLVIDPATADLLVRHGWKPPVERDRTVLLPAAGPEADRG